MNSLYIILCHICIDNQQNGFEFEGAEMCSVLKKLQISAFEIYY